MKKYDLEKLPRVLLRCMFFIPFFLGTAGFLKSGESVSDAMFKSLTMYALNYGETPPNLIADIARWASATATFSGLAILASKYSKKLRAGLLYLFCEDSTAVLADDDTYFRLKKEIPSCIFRCSGEILPAHRYILFREEEENLSFYFSNSQKLAGKKVYLRCSSLRAQEVADCNLKLVSPEEITARIFWKEAGLYESYLACRHDIKISLIGFGKLGEELLIHGLLNNIFSPLQHFEYHIYSNDSSFRDIYHEICHIDDGIYFHEESWMESIADIDTSDLVLICEQSRQPQLIQDLLLALASKPLDIFTNNDDSLALFENSGRMKIHPIESNALRAENLFDDKTLLRAKRINLRYAHLYNNVEENAANEEAEWLKLNSFTRYSNISAADYHDIRLQMLAHWGVNEIKKLSAEQLEVLSELEHIRWCRFHYLSGWKYAPAVNDKIKNAEARTHSLLVPYKCLPEAEKEKDRENIRLMLSLKDD